jgi:hypothetical protein
MSATVAAVAKDGAETAAAMAVVETSAFMRMALLFTVDTAPAGAVLGERERTADRSCVMRG